MCLNRLLTGRTNIICKFYNGVFFFWRYTYIILGKWADLDELRLEDTFVLVRGIEL